MYIYIYIKIKKIHYTYLIFSSVMLNRRSIQKYIIHMAFNTKPKNVHFKRSINSCHITLNNYYLNINNLIS